MFASLTINYIELDSSKRGKKGALHVGVRVFWPWRRQGALGWNG